MSNDGIAFDIIARDSASEVIQRIIDALSRIPDVKRIDIEGDET